MTKPIEPAPVEVHEGLAGDGVFSLHQGKRAILLTRAQAHRLLRDLENALLGIKRGSM